MIGKKALSIIILFPLIAYGTDAERVDYFAESSEKSRDIQTILRELAVDEDALQNIGSNRVFIRSLGRVLAQKSVKSSDIGAFIDKVPMGKLSPDLVSELLSAHGRRLLIDGEHERAVAVLQQARASMREDQSSRTLRLQQVNADLAAAFESFGDSSSAQQHLREVINAGDFAPGLTGGDLDILRARYNNAFSKLIKMPSVNAGTIASLPVPDRPEMYAIWHNALRAKREGALSPSKIDHLAKRSLMRAALNRNMIAIDALAQRRDPGLIGFFRALSTPTDDGLFFDTFDGPVVIASAMAGDEIAFRRILQALRGQSPWKQDEAINGLARIANPAAHKVLVELLTDTAPRTSVLEIKDKGLVVDRIVEERPSLGEMSLRALEETVDSPPLEASAILSETTANAWRQWINND